MIDDNHLRTGWQVLHMLFKRSPQNNGAVCVLMASQPEALNCRQEQTEHNK